MTHLSDHGIECSISVPKRMKCHERQRSALVQRGSLDNFGVRCHHLPDACYQRRGLFPTFFSFCQRRGPRGVFGWMACRLLNAGPSGLIGATCVLLTGESCAISVLLLYPLRSIALRDLCLLCDDRWGPAASPSLREYFFSNFVVFFLVRCKICVAHFL